MPSPLLHFDITGPDEAALHAFYGSVLGWEVAPQGPGYALVTPGDGPRGAIVEGPEPSLTIGIGVADLDAATAAVEALGGTVVMPPMNNGWVTKAQVQDPAGNLVTLIQT